MAAAIPLTEYAQKYGALPELHVSGLTPVSPLFPSLTPIPDAKSNVNVAAEGYQRSVLFGFTTRELSNLDAISSRTLRPGNLSNGISPLFRRWESNPPQSFPRFDLYKLENGQGEWTMDNPVVERVMQPILKLATRMVYSEEVLPWFAALMNGKRIPIPENRIRDADKGAKGKNLISYHPVSNPDLVAIAQQRDQAFEKLVNDWGYQWGFQSLMENPINPGVGEVIGGYGLTTTNSEEMRSELRPQDAKWQIFTFITLDYVNALFRSDLTDAERMGLQYAIANTMVHEAMHALGYTVPGEVVIPLRDQEPYFEDNALPEIGYTFEMEINGGILDPFTEKPGPPLGHWLDAVWPAITHRYMGNWSPNLQNPGLSMHTITYPIPVSVYTDIQQTAFWEVAHRKFGKEIAHFRTFRQGCHRDWTVQPPQGSTAEHIDLLMEGMLVYRQSFISHKLDSTRRLQKVAAYMNGLKHDEITLTPKGRHLIRFGEDLVSGAVAELKFWKNVGEQVQGVDALMSIVSQYSSLQREEQFMAFHSTVSILHQLRENHEAVVAATDVLGWLGRSKYIDRIRQLLKWNRNTQCFARQVEATARSADQQVLANTLHQDIIAFERCRMRLWHPTTEIRDTPDATDIEQLRNISRAALDGPTNPTHALMIHLCRTMTTDKMVPQLPAICARMGLEALHYHDATDSQGRYERLESCMKEFFSFRRGAPFGWLMFLREWGKFGNSVRHEMRRIHAPRMKQ